MQYQVVKNRERKRNRLQNYDYSQNGSYFVTICVKNREEFLGEIKNNKTILNEFGKMTENWRNEMVS